MFSHVNTAETDVTSPEITAKKTERTLALLLSLVDRPVQHIPFSRHTLHCKPRSNTVAPTWTYTYVHSQSKTTAKSGLFFFWSSIHKILLYRVQMFRANLGNYVSLRTKCFLAFISLVFDQKVFQANVTEVRMTRQYSKTHPRR